MRRYIFTILKGVGYGIGIAFASFLLNSCDVHAASVSTTPDNCYFYRLNTIAATSGSVSQTSSANQNWNICRASSDDSYNSQRFDFNNISTGVNGNGIVSFMYMTRSGSSLDSVSIQTGGSIYYCSVSTGYYPSPSFDNLTGTYYSVFCNNVPLSNTQNFIIRFNHSVYPEFKILSLGQISSNFNFYAEKDIAQAIQDNSDSINSVKDSVNDVKDSITNSNVDDASSSGGSFFEDFTTESHGLTGIVSAPLRLINKFTGTCSSIHLSIWDSEFDLPCGSTFFGLSDVKPFVDIVNVILGGLIAYGAARGIYKKVEDFKDPDNSKVEVIDL